MGKRSISPRILEVGSYLYIVHRHTHTHTQARKHDAIKWCGKERDNLFTYMHTTSAINTNKAVLISKTKRNVTVYDGVLLAMFWLFWQTEEIFHRCVLLCTETLHWKLNSNSTAMTMWTTITMHDAHNVIKIRLFCVISGKFQ